MCKKVFEKVVEVICKIAEIPPETIDPEMSLDSPEIGLSSLDIIEVFIELESIYNIQFDNNVIDIKLIKNIASIIETKTQQLYERQELIDEVCNNLFGEESWV